jgi:hypothetical protein
MTLVKSYKTYRKIQFSVMRSLYMAILDTRLAVKLLG